MVQYTDNKQIFFNDKQKFKQLIQERLNNNIPLTDSKKTKKGIKKRIQILNNHIKNCEDVLEDSYQKYCHKKIKKDDILDAMSLAVSAMYWKKNNKRKITQIPKKDEKGIALEIYY